MTMPSQSIGFEKRHFSISLDVIKIIGTSVLFFTVFDGFARFAPAPSLIWMFTYGVIVLNFIFDPRRFIAMALENWPVFLVPLFAMISTIWSSAPLNTLMAAFQLTMTVFVANLIGRGLTTRHIMLALLIAQGFGCWMSLMNLGIGFMPAQNALNGTLIGIYGHKTALGYSAILSALALISWLFFAKRSAWGVLYAALVGPIVFWTASLTAILGYAGIFLLLVLRSIQSLNPLHARRVFAIVTVLFCGLTLSATLAFSFYEEQVLSALGKNATLTGRTVLWDQAYKAWADMPVVGIGFSAFWHSEAYASDVAFVHAYVDDRVDGFHNAFIEAGVALGLIGFSMILVMVTVPLARLATRLFVLNSVEALIWFGLMLAYVVPAMLMQDVGFKQHSGSYIMLVLSYIFAGPSGARRDETT